MKSLTFSAVDFDLIQKFRTEIPTFKQRRTDIYDTIAKWMHWMKYTITTGQSNRQHYNVTRKIDEFAIYF